MTSYVAVTGPGTVFPGATSTRLEDITDGTANTLFVVEVSNVDIPWTAPRDLDVRSMSFRVNDPKPLDFEPSPRRRQRRFRRRQLLLPPGYDHPRQAPRLDHDRRPRSRRRQRGHPGEVTPA